MAYDSPLCNWVGFHPLAQPTRAKWSLDSWKSWWRALGMTFKCLKLCRFVPQGLQGQSHWLQENQHNWIHWENELSGSKISIKFSSHAIIDFYLKRFGNLTQSLHGWTWPLGWSLSLFVWVCRLILWSCFKIKIKQSAGVHLGRMHQTKSASARELHWCNIESTWGWTQEESRINLWIQKDKLNKILQSFSGKSLDDRVSRSEHQARRSCSPGARLCCHRYFMLFPRTNKLAGSTNDDGQGRHEELLPWIGGCPNKNVKKKIKFSSQI